jgi:ubiquinone/menaquinone biosynthesis C-methylase UbiE
LAIEQFHDYDQLFLERIQQVAKTRFQNTDIPDLLDVGTGTGRLLIKVAKLDAFKNTACIGTDFFKDMIDVANGAILQEPDVENVKFAVDDAHAQSFPDNSFDVVISRSTIHHWAEPPKALREIYRVLKIGGIAILHEPRKNPTYEAIKTSNANRSKIGVEPHRLGEKYAVEEIEAFLSAEGILKHCKIYAPDNGVGAMGFELQIRKKA